MFFKSPWNWMHLNNTVSGFCRVWWGAGRLALWKALSSFLFGSPRGHRVFGHPWVQHDLWLSRWHGAAGWSLCVQRGVSLQIPQQLCYWLEPNIWMYTVYPHCRCMLAYLQNCVFAGSLESSNASWVWPGGSDWQFANPGESLISECKNWYGPVGYSCSTHHPYYSNIWLLFFFPSSLSFLVLARPVFCCACRSQAARWTAAGASGARGQSAHFHAEEESSWGNACAITRPLKAGGEAAWEWANSGKTATHTHAMVSIIHSY